MLGRSSRAARAKGTNKVHDVLRDISRNVCMKKVFSIGRAELWLYSLVVLFHYFQVALTVIQIRCPRCFLMIRRQGPPLYLLQVLLGTTILFEADACGLPANAPEAPGPFLFVFIYFVGSKDRQAPSPSRLIIIYRILVTQPN